MDADGKGLRFTASSARLPSGTYQVTLRSGLNGFHSFFGNLDGDRDGIPGGDYQQRLQIGDATSLSGQQSDVDQAQVRTQDLPIYLSSQGDVKTMTFSIKCDPSHGAIKQATLGKAMPAGTQIQLQAQGDDVVQVTITSPQALAAGRHLVAHLHTGASPHDSTAIHEEASQRAQLPAHDQRPAVQFDGNFASFALAGASAYADVKLRQGLAPQRKKWQSAFVAGGEGKGIEDPNRELRIRLD
jgi:hypothetical protein